MQLKETLLSLFLKAAKIIICMYLGLVKSFEQTKQAMANGHVFLCKIYFLHKRMAELSKFILKGITMFLSYHKLCDFG